LRDDALLKRRLALRDRMSCLAAGVLIGNNFCYVRQTVGVAFDDSLDSLSLRSLLNLNLSYRLLA